MTSIYYKDNDNVIEIDGAMNSITGDYLNTATVTLTSIKDLSGVAVTGVTFPMTMTYVTASNGKYQAIIDKAAVITNGKEYTAIVDATQSGIDGHWELSLIAKTRTS
jgi:hypothetical protein